MQAYVGSTTDADILIAEGIQHHLGEEGALLYDKGAPAFREALGPGQKLIEPATKQDGRLSEKQVIDSRVISERRSHIERVVGMLKQMHVLRDTLPLHQVALFDMYLKVCVCIVKFRGPLAMSSPTRSLFDDAV